MPTAQTPKFKAAVEQSRKLKQKPTQDEMLELYSFFKQGSQDPPIEQSPTPGVFDLAGKTKRKAWQKVVDEGTTPEQAQEKYVQVVERLKGKYGYDA